MFIFIVCIVIQTTNKRAPQTLQKSYEYDVVYHYCSRIFPSSHEISILTTILNGSCWNPCGCSAAQQVQSIPSMRGTG